MRDLLGERCVYCHDADETNGGLDLSKAIAEFNPARDQRVWEKVEHRVIRGEMPPAEEQPLSTAQRQLLGDWFTKQFVMPGGIRHPGPSTPRRLTREELQNSLEDILHVDIRVTVTNSRLHVIPDTIVEKFFPVGVHGQSGFSNDSAELMKQSANIQANARCFSLVLSLLDSNKRARESLFGKSMLPLDMSADEVDAAIFNFGASAFRRPLTEAEQEAFRGVYRKLSQERSTYEALKSTFLAILLSPPFSYRFEAPAAKPSPVVGHELASRLSYFLWSSPPDATLRKLAERGELHQQEALIAQVQRMLASPKRIALAENLGGEWFDYKKLRQQSSVNKRSDKMAGFYRTQYEEALLFFDGVLRYQQPIFSLVDADWGYSNRHQDGIYGVRSPPKTFSNNHALPPINVHYRDAVRTVYSGNYEYKHAPLQLVDMTDPNRGGLVTMGPTMSVTSTENRTSPIRRGVWILERVLGEHFEPPKDVPSLEETQKKVGATQKNLSATELLKLHSSQTGCASCHRHIDPIGFGLEVFDPLGIARQGVSATPTGHKYQWKKNEIPSRFADRSWNLDHALKPGAAHRIHFQWTQGAHRLDVKNVRLVAGDVELVDAHVGFSGAKNHRNVWTFALPEDAPTNGWQLIAEVKGDGGTDSTGDAITVSGPDDKAGGFTLPNGKSFTSPGELKRILVTDYREQVKDNAVRRVLAYALGRRIQPVDRPAIRDIKRYMTERDDRFTALLEAVVLSYPFRHKEEP